MIYFPYIYRTIPLSYDDSMSYYAQLLAINKILENLGEEIAKIEKTINDIDKSILEDVKKELAAFQKKIDAEITALKSEIEEETDTKFTSLVDEVEKKLQLQDVKINQFIAETDGKIVIVRQEIAEILTGLDNIYTYIDTSNEEYWKQMKEYIDEIYTSRKIYYVKNPVTKKIDEINNALEMMYYVSTNALSCDEYAELQLTADSYADLQLSCIMFLRELRNYYNLRQYTKTVSMWNPYSGKFENVIETVKQLVKFHETNSLTAAEYAELQLTADAYAEKAITAYDYYVRGKILLTM